MKYFSSLFKIKKPLKLTCQNGKCTEPEQYSLSRDNNDPLQPDSKTIKLRKRKKNLKKSEKNSEFSVKIW